MLSTEGEDYSNLGTIKATGGIVPDATWPKSWEKIQAIVPIAADLGLNLVTFHIGFIPPNETDPTYESLVQRVIQIADIFQSHGINLGFETGQENAHTLRAFLEHIDRPNIGVNFDPGNMILYNKGDP
ncbi:MAG TPA: sugar phosphate isomerase/epimerase, partial [Oceanospirillaceae bacterium]|nr:sugar phosphate isomerase/epimerase [Oceanospirillaceae bacterium]